MKCFIEDFRELDIDELLAVNGGYGSGSSGGGYKKTSGGGGGGSGSGSYGAVTSNSRNQTSWDVWVANKDGRNSSGEITRPHDPYRDSPRNSGNYKGTSFVPDNSSTSTPKNPLYIQQRDFSNIYGNEFGNTACASTSLLNEISERYTLETGLVMTRDQSIAAMKAAVSAGHIGSSKIANNGVEIFNATVNDWAAAANTMWGTTGLNGSFVVNETVNADHVIYALDTKGGPAADHFVNSNGDGTFYDPYYDTTFKVEDYHLQEGRNYRGVDFVK